MQRLCKVDGLTKAFDGVVEGQDGRLALLSLSAETSGDDVGATRGRRADQGRVREGIVGEEPSGRLADIGQRLPAIELQPE